MVASPLEEGCLKGEEEDRDWTAEAWQRGEFVNLLYKTSKLHGPMLRVRSWVGGSRYWTRILERKQGRCRKTKMSRRTVA